LARLSLSAGNVFKKNKISTAFFASQFLRPKLPLLIPSGTLAALTAKPVESGSFEIKNQNFGGICI
jgi:hypothetical protein